MNSRNAHFALRTLGLTTLLSVGAAWSQTGNYMPTNINNTASALLAHQIQGEYFGVTSAGDTLGAWVVARSNNSYALTLLPGGLVAIPGETGGNWNGVNKYTGTATWNSTTNDYVVTTAAGFSTTSITGSGYQRVLNGTTNVSGVTFALNRVSRKSPTLGLKPKTEWGTLPGLSAPLRWFDSAAAAASSTTELAKWANNGNNPQLQYGGYLYRGARTTATHQSGYLHIEMMSAFYPAATGQNRGNSGVYLHQKYEAQVLDSYGLTGANNELGGIYGVSAPRINAALPPMQFQTYDIYFTPRTSGANGAAQGAAVMTVYLNGVLVQDSVPVPVTTEAGATGSQLTAAYLALQNHSNEVVFNNIWFVPFSGTNHAELRAALPWQTVLSGTTALRPGRAVRGARTDVQAAGPRFDLTGRRLPADIARLVSFPKP